MLKADSNNVRLAKLRTAARVMLKSITLTAEERLIKAARTRAQKKRTTLNNPFNIMRN